MKVSSRVKSGWENRFPGLTGKWTHWKITGDGVLLGIVSGERLTAALDLIEKNHGQFSSIKASRATVDHNSELRDEERHFSEISNFIKDEKFMKGEKEPDH
jgi:hypothetical protein